MARRNITMQHIKQLLLLRSRGIGIKQCSRELNLARNTVKKYLARCDELDHSLDELLSLAEPELLGLLEQKVPLSSQAKQQFDSMAEGLLRELDRPGVTRRLLWEEHVASGVLTMEYSWFCELLRAHRKHKKTTMIMKHEPGSRAYLDFTGKRLHYVDRFTGQRVACEVLVLTFGYSNMTFARALPSQKVDDVLTGLAALLHEAGGSPAVLVPDNMKTAVSKPDRYEPVVQPAFWACCTHYNMVVLPARVGKPQDKAKVERHVRFLYEQVYARMRNDVFYGLEELNAALRSHLDRAMDRIMADYQRSRRELFAHEQKALQPLPSSPHVQLHTHQLKLEANCHVRIRAIKSYFSAPHTLIGERLTVVRSSEQVTIYHAHQPVATHAISRGKLYHTEERHLPSQYRQYAGRLDKERLVRRGYAMGSDVGRFVESLLHSKPHPEQAFKSCEGVLQLIKVTTAERLNRCCLHASERNKISYAYVRQLAENPRALIAIPHTQSSSLPLHENIRGASNFQ